MMWPWVTMKKSRIFQLSIDSAPFETGKKENWLVYSIRLVSTLSWTRQLPRFMACTSWWCISQFVPDKNHRSLTRGGCQVHHGAATVHHPSVELRNQGFSRCKPWISDTTLRKSGLSTDMLLQNDHWVSTRMRHPKIPVVVDHHLPGSSGSQNGPKKVYPPIWDKPNYDKKTELACTCVTCLIMPRSSAFQKRGSLIEKQNVNIVEPAAAWMSSSCDKACLSRAPGSKPDTWALIDGNVLWNIQGWFSRYELSGNGQ